MELIKKKLIKLTQIKNDKEKSDQIKGKSNLLS